jgi:hypothetical protein
MNLHGGLTARGQGYGLDVRDESFVTRDCEQARPSFYVGLCDVLGRNKADEVLVSCPVNQDVVVYTLRGHVITVTGLESIQAVSEYDLGRRVGHRLLEGISSPVLAPCIGQDPMCPCQDGLACHYRDAGKGKSFTAGFPLPHASPEHP